MNPGAVSWEEGEPVAHCAHAKIPRNSDSSVKHHKSFFLCTEQTITLLLISPLQHFYNTYSFTETAHVHYFCLGKAPEPVQGQNSRDKDVAIGDLVGLGASEIAISRYGIVIF